MKLQYNIGLNNNPEFSLHKVDKILKRHPISEGMSYNSGLHIGEYNGQPERPAVIVTETDYKKVSSVLNYVEQLCGVHDQECIAVRIDKVGYLVYNIKYEGEKQNFDSTKFITITGEVMAPPVVCYKCGHNNKADAIYCNKCLTCL